MSQVGTAIGGSVPPTVSTLTLVERVFTENGTYTPTADLQYAWIRIWGAGGAGGGGDAAEVGMFTGGVAAGGGAGEYAEGVFSVATIGASQSVTIGAGGTAAAGSDGGTGGTTSVGALITAVGGSGGEKYDGSGSTQVAGGVGGTGGSGGNVRSDGLPGYDINSLSASGNASGGSPFPGVGAPTFWGGQLSVPIINTPDPAAGVDGTGYGSGGGGCYQVAPEAGTNPAIAGGDGAAGVVIIMEYILA